MIQILTIPTVDIFAGHAPDDEPHTTLLGLSGAGQLYYWVSAYTGKDDAGKTIVVPGEWTALA